MPYDLASIDNDLSVKNDETVIGDVFVSANIARLQTGLQLVVEVEVGNVRIIAIGTQKYDILHKHVLAVGVIP
jgi:hypothetical protein